MKAEFLKLAGVKTEKAFYKKYPTEAAFFKAHPEAKKMIKKAQVGIDLNGDGVIDAEEKRKYSLSLANPFNASISPNAVGQQYDQLVDLNKPVDPNSQFGFKQSSIPMANYDLDASGYKPVTLTAEQLADDEGVTETPQNFKKTGKNFGEQFNKYAPYVGQLIGGIQNLKAQRQARKSAEQWRDVSGLVAQASGLRETQERRYVRPEDNIFTTDQFFPSQGVGTNVLAKDGAEIQNTYAPGYLYDDLGYEPLDESSIVKQYAYGGGVPKAEGGFSAFMTGGGGDMLGNLAGYATGNNAGGQIGGAIGGGLGTVFGGPVGGAIGNTIGTLAGGLLDTNAKRQKKAQAQMMRNLNSAAMSQGAQSLQQQYSGFMEDGGQITNPQLITKFGEYSVKDLLVPPHDADMLRAGGNLRSYTPVSERGLSTMEEGGDLQTHWGGYAEPISQNPYLPANGETVMFRGQSHDESDGYGNTGIGITYGNSPVEVERGEPAIQLQEPNGETNLTVFGNLKIPSAYIPILGDEKAKGKKFKNYVAELSKQEKRQNNIVEKSTSLLDNLELNTSFDKLKMASAEASILGANMKLKDIADKKINAAALQSSINDTAEEYGLDADALARGKVKMNPEVNSEYAKKGKTVTKQTTTPPGKKYKNPAKPPKSIPYTQAGETGNPAWDNEEKYDQVWTPSVKSAFSDKVRAKKMLNYITNYSGEGAEEVRNNLNMYSTEEDKLNFLIKEATNKKVGPIHKIIDKAMNWTSTKPAELRKEEPAKQQEEYNYEVAPYKKNTLVDIYNQVLPFLRPTDQEELDGMQLAGEMYALSTNQLEPVQAQTFQPELGVPYDISLQDQLNANQADYRAAQRMVGYNPAAQAMLNAQKYEANQKVLGEQFRMNQAMKDQVYNANRNILNDAKLKNLASYDQQYQRQAQARSNTKATTQAALNSIASKYAQNKLENRTLGVYENLYNYRFDPSGRAINMNPLFQPNMPYLYSPDGEITHIPEYDEKGKIKGYKKINKEEDKEDLVATTTDKTTQRRGGKTKKNYSQSSIVRAFK